MRIVIDTNVFVSLLIRPGERLLPLIDFIDQHATVIYSTDTWPNWLTCCGDASLPDTPRQMTWPTSWSGSLRR
jgi:predicted nucleic acid-binding protein